MPAILTLEGKKGLIVGLANEKSIAYGCAKTAQAAGAALAITCQGGKAIPYTEPLAMALGADIFRSFNVQNTEEQTALFNEIEQRWGQLDFLMHSVAYAPKADLCGRVVDSSLAGFLEAMDVSCHSFIRLAKAAIPLMKNGGSIVTFSYQGADRAVSNYGLMGPVKAALESTVRYLAMELGEYNIRVNSISPGPIFTRAASGIRDFSALAEQDRAKSALKRLVTIEEVGNLAVFLASDLSSAITGHDHYIDAGSEAKT